MLPRAGRIGVLYNRDDPGKAIEVRETEAAARARGMTVQVLGVREEADFEGAFHTIGRERAEALVVLGENLTVFHRARIIEFTSRSRMPAMYAYRVFVETGGLISYGPSLEEMFRGVAVFVDKILNGAKHADLPVEQPTKFELVVNLKTATALGLTIPQTILLQADQVIE